MARLLDAVGKKSSIVIQIPVIKKEHRGRQAGVSNIKCVKIFLSKNKQALQ